MMLTWQGCESEVWY